jgi:hypothetical protein
MFIPGGYDDTAVIAACAAFLSSEFVIASATLSVIIGMAGAAISAMLSLRGSV